MRSKEQPYAMGTNDIPEIIVHLVHHVAKRLCVQR
jgi:hypothetical protein